jgi:peptidoglycan/xylan/chitin deacetylase (PgdA/CDA1 family)
VTESTSQKLLKSDQFVKPPSQARSAAVWTMSKVAAGLQNLHGNCCGEGFGILMYHRIAERTMGVPAPTLNVTPKQLRKQLAGLLSRGFECWPLTKLVAAHCVSRPVPANVFAVTFDDGYENNYVHAWPILCELNIPATIFLATKYIDTDQPFPFDDWSAAGSNRTPPSAWRPVCTKQCREMLASGLIELGAHTHSHHRDVGRRGEFLRDMRLCLDLLSDRFGVVRPTFAFPYGHVTSELIDASRKLDISCATTTRHRRTQAGDDVYQWGRFHVGQNDTPGMLAAKLSGWYPMLASACRGLSRPFEMIWQASCRNSINTVNDGLVGDSPHARKDGLPR